MRLIDGLRYTQENLGELQTADAKKLAHLRSRKKMVRLEQRKPGEIIQVRGWRQILPSGGLEGLLAPSQTSAGTVSLGDDQVQLTDNNVLWLLIITATKLMNL